MSDDKRIVFNKANLDKIPFSENGKQIIYYDSSPKSLLAIRVGATTKKFLLYGRIKHGNPVKITLGDYTKITIAQAHQLATQAQDKANQGINLNKEREVKQKQVELEKAEDTQTVRWLIDTYKEEHIKGKKGSSKGTLRSISDTLLYFGARKMMTLKKLDNGTWVENKEIELEDWLDRPFRSITKQEVLNRFNIYCIAAPTRKKQVLEPISRTHQIAFRFLRAAYNYHIPRCMLKNQNDIIENPLSILKALKLWEESEVKTEYVDFATNELYDWWTAVKEYDYIEYLVSDYILFSLLQGGRSIDIAPLEWSQIDFKKKLIDYRDTKNGQDYFFPITNFAVDILKRRKAKCRGSKYVFPHKETKSGYIPQDCKFHFKKIGDTSGKKIAHHDLRRTFGTIARHLKIDERTIDYCLKHTIHDVNAHYFMGHEAEIRDALQKVEDFILNKVKKLAPENQVDQIEKVAA